MTTNRSPKSLKRLLHSLHVIEHGENGPNRRLMLQKFRSILKKIEEPPLPPVVAPAIQRDGKIKHWKNGELVDL